MAYENYPAVQGIPIRSGSCGRGDTQSRCASGIYVECFNKPRGKQLGFRALPDDDDVEDNDNDDVEDNDNNDVEDNDNGAVYNNNGAVYNNDGAVYNDNGAVYNNDEYVNDVHHSAVVHDEYIDNVHDEYVNDVYDRAVDNNDEA